ncbi:MAG: pseudouridine synthase [Dehalococcoidia bacterium]|nr:pseudouridine synthase [Dehalococcoidia bacterium]
MADQERLQKYLARSGIGSRRRCEEVIAQGRAAVNRVTVILPGTKVDPASDVVTVDGIRVAPKPDLVYVMLNKPVGYISTVVEQRGRPTVMDLVHDPARVFPPLESEIARAADLKDHRLFPVGRLDLQTEGLMILTDDGEFANLLTHPRYALDKEYFVEVRGRPSEAAIKRLREGVIIETEGRPTSPATVRIQRAADRYTLLTIIIHEGRNRQVRRMLEAVGHEVQRLVRVRVGPLRLDGLPAGRFRFLNPKEVLSLRDGN